jgi:hypothetical protein
MTYHWRWLRVGKNGHKKARWFYFNYTYIGLGIIFNWAKTVRVVTIHFIFWEIVLGWYLCSEVKHDLCSR